MNLSQATDFTHWVERAGCQNPTISFDASRDQQGDHQVFPWPYRDVPEAVESGGLAGRMDAAWTQRDGGAERIREQNQRLDAPSVIPFYIYSPLQLGFAIYCVHRRGFAGLLASIVRPLRVRVRPRAWDQIFRKAVPVPSSRSD